MWYIYVGYSALVGLCLLFVYAPLRILFGYLLTVIREKIAKNSRINSPKSTLKMAEAVSIPVVNALSPDFDASQIKRTEVDLNPIQQPHKLAYVLDNVFTAEECERLIEISEAEGYSPAMVHSSDGTAHLAPGYRDGFRIMIDDKEFVKVLFSRIAPFLPNIFQERKLVQINERLRFLRYHQDDEFKPHFDAHYVRDDRSARTLITLQMYLNEGFEGGETTFLQYTKDTEIRVPVVPKIGRILVFEHQILHEGSLVKSGDKYTIRTDVLYTYHKHDE